MTRLKNIRNVLSDFIRNPGKGLYQRTLRSGVWAFVLRITERGFDIVKLIILARVLDPNDFGLMGIALLSIACLETFSQTGFAQALIQKKDRAEEYLDTAWTFMLIRNFVIFAILFLGASYIANFFEAPKVAPIMRVIGLSLFFGGAGGIGGFANIGVLYFQKELEFNKQFIYHLTGTLADFVISVTAAIALRSVWALVFGLLAGNIVRFFVGYLIHPYRPRLNFDFDKAQKLFGFGKWVLASSILVFLVTQGDDIFVGKLLGTTMLGFYQMAYRISNMPATEITHVTSQVTFPAYSKLQDNPAGLREAYLKVFQLTAFISVPLAAMIIVLAPEFTEIFLGKKWVPMVPAMQILALAGLMRSIAATAGYVFYAVGRPQIDTRWQIIRLTMLVISIYTLTLKWGIVGASVAVCLSILVSTIGFSFMIAKITRCETRNFAKMISFPLTSGIIMMAVIFALKININTVGLWVFLLFVLAGTFVYLATTYLQDKFLHYGMLRLLKENFVLFRGVL